jgi:acyl-CoA synthetase (NDP forming)
MSLGPEKLSAEAGESAKTLAALDGILNAGSVALVGASTDPRKFGYMTLNSLIQGDYQGEIYPIKSQGR